MKKYLVLAALLCGISVAGMAADSEKPEKVQPTHSPTALSNSEEPKQEKSLLIEYDCITVVLTCGLTGQECGEDYQLYWQVKIAEAQYCDNW